MGSKYLKREYHSPGLWVEGESIPFKDEDPHDYRIPIEYIEPTDFELKIAMADSFIANEKVKGTLNKHIKKVRKILRDKYKIKGE